MKHHFVHAVVLATLLIGALLASVFGYLSNDAWNYLLLAQSTRSGQWCSVQGTYAAVFPCGYPMVIALVSPWNDIASLLVTSKLANLILLAASFWLLARTFKHLLIPILIILNPITIAIYFNTWSENLFLFAFCGVLHSVARLDLDGQNRRQLFLLTLFLILGCSSRYFFGPFAAILFIGILLCHGRALARHTFPAFAIAGALFLGYQYLNHQLTGYSTGMPRIPAPESLVYLVFRFVRAWARDLLLMGLATLMLWLFHRRRWQTMQPSLQRSDPDTRNAWLLAFVGVGYLVLSFMLRVRTQYNLYEFRTIGYGSVFMLAAMAGLMLRPRTQEQPTWAPLAMTALAAFAILAAPSSQLLAHAREAAQHGLTPAWRLLRDDDGLQADTPTVVTLGVPMLSRTMVGWPTAFYRDGTRIIKVHVAPFREAESATEFLKRVRATQSGACWIDFTRFPTHAAFQAYLDETYPVDIQLRSWKLKTIGLPTFDPTLRSHFSRIFEPGRLIPCSAGT